MSGPASVAAAASGAGSGAGSGAASGRASRAESGGVSGSGPGSPSGANPAGAASAGGITGEELRASEASAGEMRSCPHCGVAASTAHLFCESCGYDFTTGALPRPLAEKLASLDTRVAPREAPGLWATGAGPDEQREPAEPTDEAGVPEGAAPEPPGAGPGANMPVAEPPPGPPPVAMPRAEPAPGPEPVATPPAQSSPAEAFPGPPDPGSLRGSAAQPAPVPGPAPGRPTPAASAPTPAASPPTPRPSSLDAPSTRAPSRQAKGDWVVEVWVDPGWFAAQETGEECPSPGVPEVVRLPGRALVGRYSSSRRAVPEVDCGADSGVSRRHAEFTTDGTRWWIEDLGSSNGTFVGPASGPLPEQPIPAGQRVEVSDDDRIYVGAWTRLVVRKATAGDLAGTG